MPQRWLVAVFALLLACNAPRSRRSSAEEEERGERSSKTKASATGKRARASSAAPRVSAPVISTPAKLQPPRPPVPPPTPPPALPPPPIETSFAPPPIAPPPIATPNLPVAPPAPAVDRAKERTWVQQVALRSEFAETGKSRAGIVARWSGPIRLSVMQGDTAVRADLLSLVPKLNEVLEPAGAPIRVVQDGDASATLKVYFAPSTALSGIARANGFEYIAGNDGFFQTFWNDRFHIQRAFVLLAVDKLRGRALRHFTFEEVTQSLGPANDSMLFGDSIFYGNGPAQDTSEELPTELSARDRKLLSFLYNHVRPGDDGAALGRAFDAHW